MVSVALDVARYLLHLAGQEPEPGVTPLQVRRPMPVTNPPHGVVQRGEHAN